MNNRAHG